MRDLTEWRLPRVGRPGSRRYSASQGLVGGAPLGGVSVLLAGLSLLGGCGPESSRPEGGSFDLDPGPALVEVRTTDGELARRRLDLDIETGEAQLEARPGVEAAETVVALRLQRASAFGRYRDDFGRVAELAEAYGGRVATTVASARHLFSAVIEDGDSPLLTRAAALIAVGRAAEVEAELEAFVALFPDAHVPRLLLAAALGARGDYPSADALLVEALRRYRGVSPFVVAEIYFRRGLLWAEQAGRPEWGEELYRRGLEHLPGHVAMSVHLAELEVEQGHREEALARLRGLIEAGTQDPEPWSRLAEWDPSPSESAKARAAADEGYRGLLSHHPQAFWDHASEFYAGPGARPELAVELALQNLAVRQTDRALWLALEAIQAAGDSDRACALAEETPTPRSERPLLDLLRSLGCR